jgi:hypothetical protein
MNRTGPDRLLDLAGPWVAALIFVAAWYLASQAVFDLTFDVRPKPKAFWADLTAHLLAGALLFSIAFNLRRFVLATFALFTALALGNALKVSILGGPLMPDDFVAAKNMLLLLDGWLLIGAAAMVALPALLLVWMIAWRKTSTWLVVGGLSGVLALLLAFPAPASRALDARFGDWVWNQRGNFEDRGLPIHLLQESLRSRVRREPVPSEDEVTAALRQLDVGRPSELVKTSASTPTRRNLHMIVLESFWDPMLLTAAELSADPIDPAFRELWATAGHAHALAPVFGGYTANTEFEILCGFPVERDNVFFEGGLRRDVPCLPQHLANSGYRTFASHPNAASFWNRVNAYRRIGFETYWADVDFELDDMNQSFLGDASLYRQVLERLGPQLAGPTPVFNYVLTYFGHLPYPLNADRPAVITAATGHETVAAYANTMYYKSRELMDFLSELRRRDPEALIVLFGDHPPALGAHFGGYRESGLLASSRADFTDEMFRTLVATPIVVIDGQRGVLSLGDLPLYQLPGLVLRLLGDTRSSMMAWTAPGAAPRAIRPLPGLHILSDGDNVTVCRDSETRPETCNASSAWLDALRVAGRDIFGGAQHALRRITEPLPDLKTAEVTSIAPTETDATPRPLPLEHES